MVLLPREAAPFSSLSWGWTMERPPGSRCHVWCRLQGLADVCVWPGAFQGLHPQQGRLRCERQWVRYCGISLPKRFYQPTNTTMESSFLHILSKTWGFPSGSAGKESACNVADLGSIPGLGRSSGEGKGYPHQYSGLENSMDCIVHGGHKELNTTEWPFTLTFSKTWDC